MSVHVNQQDMQIETDLRTQVQGTVCVLVNSCVHAFAPGSFYDRFRVLQTKRATAERSLKVKPGSTLTHQGPGFGSDVWTGVPFNSHKCQMFKCITNCCLAKIIQDFVFHRHFTANLYQVAAGGGHEVVSCSNSPVQTAYAKYR